MQETIRTKSAEEFPLVSKFIDFKESGKLADAKDVASKFFQFVEKESEYKGSNILNINDF